MVRSRGIGRRNGLVLLGIAFAGSLLLLCRCSAAGAEFPSQWVACQSPAGGGAGQCSRPRGVAANPENGHLFVADEDNDRVVEFNALGQFVKTWGWDVTASGPGDDTLVPEDQFEICVPSNGDVCKKAISGSGAGQFNASMGVALDSGGNVYVVDFSNKRVEKFDRRGNFLLSFGSPGIGSGQFGAWAVGSFIAITPADKVYVGDAGRIQRFDTDGNYQEEISLPGVTVQGLAADSAGNLYYIDSGKPGIHKVGPSGIPGTPSKFDLPFSPPTALAVDSVGNVFAFGPTCSVCSGSFVPTDPIIEFSPSGEIIDEFGEGEFDRSNGMAANLCSGSEAPGNLYVTNADLTKPFIHAYGTQPLGCFKATTEPPTEVEETSARLRGTVDPDGSPVDECRFELGPTTAYGTTVPCAESSVEIGTGATPVPVHAAVAGLDPGKVYHYRLLAKIDGETETGADESFKTTGPPVISDDHTVAVSDTEAKLRALVNPEGFEASYRFEYTTEAACEATGFTDAQSTPIAMLGDDRSDHVAIAELEGLTPGSSYCWRIVATNTAAGDPVVNGEPHIFFTYRPAGTESGCANHAFRTEASASLPDCRAYEMVSPVDKNGGDIVRDLTSAADPGGYTQARPDGDALTYTAYAAFGSAPNAYRFNQYIARRTERGQPGEGWSNEGINLPVAGQEVDKTIDTFGFLRYYMAFSPDLCSGWLVDYQTPAPSTDGQEGYPNLYRRENCGVGTRTIEALVSSPAYTLPGSTIKDYVDRKSVQGYAADGRQAVFVAKAKLTGEAAAGDVSQIYDSFEGALHLVSLLPSGLANPGDSVVGSGPRAANIDTAVSEDGSRVYWTGGKLYLRLHPEQGKVGGECATPAVACTIPVSAGGGFFWTASSDGSKAIYTEGGDLYEFDLARREAGEEASLPIAEEVRSVVGASEDLSRVYLISDAVLPGAEAEASAGQPNLYLHEGGASTFIATLSEKDVGEKEPGASIIAYDLASTGWYARATRVSEDGSRIAFPSRAPLTGYDNATPDGRAAVEVFAYQATSGELECVSCNPSGGRPNVVRDLRDPYSSPWAPGLPSKVPAAAWLPTWEQPLHASNLLSADGNRLFFHSFDALLPRDTNDAQDVYEWEAPGTGGCDVADASYFAQNGGCLYLISSGESSYESEFWEASEDGEDVFFTTESSLLPQDPGSIDLYDARVGGGFPQRALKAPCEGEACQSPPPPPEYATPASSSYSGPGSPPEGGKKPRCPKGKRLVHRRGKARCVKKKNRHGRRRAGQSGRAER